jgi:hypothetical protein
MLVVLVGFTSIGMARTRARIVTHAKTGHAISITDVSATVTGTVVSPTRAFYYFTFGESNGPSRRTSWVRAGTKWRRRLVVEMKLSGLRPATEYRYRLVAALCRHCRRATGAIRTLRTAPPPLPPSVQTGPPNVVGQTTATLTGSVDPENLRTTYYFEYGPTTTYGATTAQDETAPTSASTGVRASLSHLAALAAYHYRLVAVSRGGTSYGTDATFTTHGYYENPVYSATDFADPFVLDNGGQHDDYWAFGTGSLFPMLHSNDLIHWTSEGTAMATKPSWVLSSGDWHPWGPSVIERGEPCPGTSSARCYIMYYVGLSAQLNVNCVGVATSATPGGPYTDQGPLALAGENDAMPIGCGDENGEGNIDPSPFVDASGDGYLYVSTDRACNDGSCPVAPTISVIPLSSDFLSAASARVPLFAGEAGTWEAAGVTAPTVEGPFMEFYDGTYYLFFSGGSYMASYGMGYATATSPTGPFTQSSVNPILAANPTVFTPGGGDDLVVGPHGGLWMLYAARQAVGAPRTLRLDAFSWQASTGPGPFVPKLNGPTSTAQPWQP